MDGEGNVNGADGGDGRNGAYGVDGGGENGGGGFGADDGVGYGGNGVPIGLRHCGGHTEQKDEHPSISKQWKRRKVRNCESVGSEGIWRDGDSNAFDGHERE
ncbi:unnamed protein product [Cylicocyclus nassatus]|uniref:Uncharacterized protein n=1 Tax=Cylicocyclus nassatus TaxID=53992 RepID=A0AA36M611_CYLNA|nr:unnamed protein product [Cylicocyclus nassatus]